MRHQCAARPSCLACSNCRAIRSAAEPRCSSSRATTKWVLVRSRRGKIEQLAEEGESGAEAVVDVSPHTDAARRLGSRYGQPLEGRVVIPFADLDLLTDELVEFGSDVLAVSPPELITSIIAKLTLVELQHTAGGRS